jgi:hypothetical protein
LGGLYNERGYGIIITTMGVGYKHKSQGVWTAWFIRIVIIAAILLCQSSSFAQTPGITVANGTASLSWPLTAYYYLLQSSTNLSGNDSWFNVATASPVSSTYSFIIPGQSNLVATAPVITDVVGSNFVVTQSTASAQQFYRLKAPVVVPVFRFAVFYEGMLEFTKTSNMILRGPVHANGPVCVGTTASLEFRGTVTTTNTITGPMRDGWTPSPWNQNTVFNGQPSYVTNVPAFRSPFGTNKPHALIDIPPANEPPNSSLGQGRLYNQAQVILIVTNATVGTNPTVYLTLQASTNGMIPGADPAKVLYIVTNASPGRLLTNSFLPLPFVSLTNTFTDKREYQTNMYVTQIDVGNYAAWLSTNEIIADKFGPAVPTAPVLYVADRRFNVVSYKLAVVRLVNGAQLPFNGGFGFTVATPNPLYIKGHYNVTADGTNFAYFPDSTIHSGSCVPAALMCDAITVLSSAFNDSISAIGNASSSNTVNAAIIAGNVPSTGTSETTFSGGVHNFIRLLEDWSGDYMVLNTSLVCLYSSQMVTNQFRNPIGWSPAPVNPYYKPPMRQWGFDPNFYDPARLPPGTPVYTLP